VSAGASSSASSFPGLQDERLVTYRGQVGVSFQLSSRTTLGLTQGLFYEPAASRYLRDIFGGGTDVGAVLPPDLDVGTEGDETLSQSTGIRLSHSLSARSSIAGTFTRWRSDYDDDDRTQAYDQGSIRYSHQLAEGLAARLGYAYGTGRSEVETDDVRTEQHLIDAGIDFNRALSLTRRTTLAFGTGTTMTRSGDESNFNVTGNVRLNHAIGRSWLTGFSYARDVRVVEGLTDLATTDRFSVDLGGSIGRRAAVNATGSYTRGRVGPEDVANAFEGMNGSAGLSIAATRNVGISVQYGYYRSLFDRTDFLLTPSVSDFGRHSAGVSVGFWGLVSIGAQYATYRTTFSRDQSVTASVSLFAPIFSRSRRPDAAR
jgi:hypothetical protein